MDIKTTALRNPLRVTVGSYSNLDPQDLEWDRPLDRSGRYVRHTVVFPAGTEVYRYGDPLPEDMEEIVYDRDLGVSAMWTHPALFLRTPDGRFYYVEKYESTPMGGGRVTVVTLIRHFSPFQMAWARRFGKPLPDSWFPPDGGGSCAHADTIKKWAWEDGAAFYDRYPNNPDVTGICWRQSFSY